MPTTVTALLVSHDGARWLPAVIAGLRAQTRPVDRVVAVDTGSKDGSAELVESAFGAVLRLPGSTSFPQAVVAGLDDSPDAGPGEWVWILHDDANPDPDALAALLEAAEEHPDADVLGPKLREWPSLRRLLELGVTISGTGRRETGLERGEYDQGQHDQVRTVLAVNTAGMLVRRRLLEELGGFDDQLPIFGNDIDFGWRAAAAGHRTIVVPQAVVFHAEAAHRGVRRTPLTGRHTHYQERRAALFTLLANSRARALPFQLLRLGLGTLLRMIGFLLVRSVGEALDELAALVSLCSSPRQILAARRSRQGRQVTDPATLRGLLAPAWVPYRHGLDFLGDVVTAVTLQAQDVAERRRAAAAENEPPPVVRRPVARDEDVIGDDTGLVARFVTSPVALAIGLFVVLALIGARPAFASLAGGGLSPVPGQAGDWWRLWAESWHPLGQGTDVPAPAYVLPLALAATLLGSPSAVVTAIFVLVVPLGLWGAWRFLRVAGRLASRAGSPRLLLLWGAATYALVPVVSGAWGDGRLGTVVVAALLPWLAHAALGFADPDPDRRWRAAFRTGLLLAVGSAFAPGLWFFALLLGLVVTGAAAVVVRSALRDRSAWGPPATALALVPLLLLPWWLPALLNGAGRALVLETGRLPVAAVDSWGLLTGRVGDLGGPTWLGAVLAVLALLALVPRATRIPVLVCWIVAAVAAVTAAVWGGFTLDLAATSTPAGLGFLVVVLQGAFVVAASLGGQALARQLAPAFPAWRRGAAAVLAVAATVVPVVGLGWFVAGGHDRLDETAGEGIPAYMVLSSKEGPAHGILVLRGDVRHGLTYSVRRGDGVTLGEDEIVDLTPEDTGFTRTVRTLVSRPTPSVVNALGADGIEYVVLPAPADGDVAATLDATGGLVQASAENRSTRAWRVARPLSASAVEGPRSWLRIGLLVLQGLAIVVVAVLCAPTSERRRPR
ncbi:glycosyltransferase family 2 protein [Nocardioides panaciterrulae]|uniref:GT2 family glycosyltransferase n=1 Tax=Nocardioides panaciterrulae TaxID=661492 RepID=A0A7Y9E483_9ACTN|nr:glycosyltransferase family 2 protein [Nocardioides panaciterrulae]NYD40946.1 GT2 family glycosyltransferase [Nocardioides panaciterrulae]